MNESQRSLICQALREKADGDKERADMARYCHDDRLADQFLLQRDRGRALANLIEEADDTDWLD